MPKRVPVEAKRVPLNCLVLPQTLAWLKTFNCSQGGAVDRAVAALMVQEGKGQIWATPVSDAMTRPRQPFKGPLLRPSEKKHGK